MAASIFDGRVIVDRRVPQVSARSLLPIGQGNTLRPPCAFVSRASRLVAFPAHPCAPALATGHPPKYRQPPTFSCSGKRRALSISNLLTCLPAIEQYWHIADMQTHPPHPKSFRLKILPISPYSSRILVLSSLQLHYFHRSGGRGVPRSASLVPLRERTTLEPAMSKVEGRRHRPRGAGALARGPCKESNRESFSAGRLRFFRWQ